MTDDIIRSVPFFASLPDNEIERTTAPFEQKELPSEVPLQVEEEMEDHICILGEGVV